MRIIYLALLAAVGSRVVADDPIVPAEDQPPAIKEASRMGVALGAAQRCGMSGDDVDTMTKLGFARLQMMAKDKELYAKAAAVMLDSQRYGSTEMPPPAGGCAVILPIASGILGNLTYIVARAEPDVPDLHRKSPLDNFAAWSGQLAVMASHCGAQNYVVDKAIALSRKYIAKESKNDRAQARADAELSEGMLQAELEQLGNKTKCESILTNFGTFFGNLDARLQ
jgi:hypothetical protein